MGNTDLFNAFVRQYRKQRWKEEEAIRMTKRNEEYQKYLESKNKDKQDNNMELV